MMAVQITDTQLRGSRVCTQWLSMPSNQEQARMTISNESMSRVFSSVPLDTDTHIMMLLEEPEFIQGDIPVPGSALGGSGGSIVLSIWLGEREKYKDSTLQARLDKQLLYPQTVVSLQTSTFVKEHNYEKQKQKCNTVVHLYNTFPVGQDCGSPVVKVSDHGRHVMSSSPVPLKAHRVGQRYTLNLSRAETSSRWRDVLIRRGGASSGIVHLT
ncbi:hypothetical protein TNCV_3073241 [Trichonephila clavipes]|nr:hypothetical protein TNCV_3073241 [Trichonephila clavipes]